MRRPSGRGFPRTRVDRGLGAAITAVLLAVCFAGGFGFAWWQAETDDATQRAVARDEVLRSGQEAIAALNTLDYRQVDAGYDRWLVLSTGRLNQELSTDPEASKDKIAKAKSVTSASVLEAAVSELDDKAGAARVIASVEITVTPAGGEPNTKRNRFEAELRRTETGWKVSALGQVPVGLS